MERLRQRFLDPPAEFSAVPFWFWNGELQEAEIARQMCDFLDHGIKAFVIHPRMGIPREIGYLSDRFMALVRFVVDEAARLDMRVVLYDEGMYPSGSAHGQVVRESPDFASRGIVLLPNGVQMLPGDRLVAKLSEAAIVERFSGGTIRGVHPGEDDGEPDAPQAADLLNPDATRCFIRHTHERYYAALAPHFGLTVFAMFTDEPNPLGRCAPEGMLPWTRGLEGEWLAMGMTFADLADVLRGVAGDARRTYDALIERRLGVSYYRPLSEWCETHGVALAGHPAEPDSIGLLRWFGIPGQDVVWRFVAPEGRKGLEGPESTQAKCASDAARHAGKRRNSNECFGCCGPDGRHWALTVDDIKWYLDWLFVRGCNLVYPHAFYYSVDGEMRYNERPPDVGPNNYWWPHARQIHDYISRMCALITDGVNQARVAVLCGSSGLPWRLPALLFKRQIEFNYLQTDELLSAEVKGRLLHVAQQAYSTVLIEDESLLTPSVQAALDRFRAAGGEVRVGELPEVQPTVMLQPACANLRASHLAHDGVHVFLLTNEDEDAYRGALTLPVHGTVERWDAWTGEMKPMSADPLPLRLERRESVVFVVDPGAAASPAQPEPLPLDRVLPVAMRWHAIGPDGILRALAALSDWQTWDGMARYGGAVRYECEFELDAAPSHATLDLGDVREMAEVSLNGCAPRALLLLPYQLDVSGMLHTGTNRLQVTVTSGVATRYDGLPQVSGLLGPVRFLVEGYR